jgi:hypothetical protein
VAAGAEPLAIARRSSPPVRRKRQLVLGVHEFGETFRIRLVTDMPGHQLRELAQTRLIERAQAGVATVAKAVEAGELRIDDELHLTPLAAPRKMSRSWSSCAPRSIARRNRHFFGEMLAMNREAGVDYSGVRRACHCRH